MNGTRFDLRVVPLAQVAADPALPACDLIMVEVDPKDAAEMELLRGLVEHQRGGPAIVATTADATLDDLRKLMRRGVVDVFPQPVQRSDVLATLEAAAKVRTALAPAPGHKGRSDQRRAGNEGCRWCRS